MFSVFKCLVMHQQALNLAATTVVMAVTVGEELQCPLV